MQPHVSRHGKEECLEHFGMYEGWSLRQFRFIFSIWDFLTVAEYNRKVDNTNAQLKVMCGRSTNVVFWQHNKHVRLPSVIPRDGAHLHANAMKNYWRSM